MKKIFSILLVISLIFSVLSITASAAKNGWANESGYWVYYSNGVMLKNTWKKDSVGWCYLDSNGRMATNKWIKDSVGWCYVGANGYCVTNTWKKDSVGWCYLDSNGRMATNKWIKDSVGWCYVGANGYCVTNTWKKDSVGWCYLDSNGRMATNKWIKDSVGWCYLGANGYCVTNTWKKDSVGWCYLDSNGRMVVDSVIADSGKSYYLDKNGYMVSNAWISVGSYMYFFGEDGAKIVNSWVEEDGGKRYVDSNGAMVIDKWINVDGAECYFDADGYYDADAIKENDFMPSSPAVETVTSTSVTLVYNEGYEYSMDCIEWQSSSVFEGLSANTEYSFYRRVAQSGNIGASLPSLPKKVTTEKFTPAAPDAPVAQSVTATSITLVATNGYEYSRNGSTWQTSPEFSGLSPNTKYRFYQRVAEGEDNFAGSTSVATYVTTAKITPEVPSAPVVQTVTDTAITLVATAGYEYSMDGVSWQSSSMFAGLSPNRTYTFYQRVAENDTTYASAASAVTTATTTIGRPVAPAAPVLAYKTYSCIMLVEVEGYEYSMDGVTWQKSSLFDNLTADTEYTFYQRVAESEDTYASPASEPAIFKTEKNDDNYIEIGPKPGTLPPV